MSTVDYMRQSINFLQEAFRVAGEGLTDEQLHHSAEGESHSIAWVLWHAARIEDEAAQVEVAVVGVVVAAFDADPEGVG